MMKLLVPESALLPLHVMFGNESDDDLMVEISGDQLSAFSRCRISITWLNALLSSLSLWL